MIRKFFLILLFANLLAASRLLAQTTYLTPQDALKLAFKSSATVVLEKHSLTREQIGNAERLMGSKIERKDWNIYVGKSAEKIDGYAIIDHEIGRMEPITFMSLITPEGRIGAIEILVYRESQGSEVSEKRFLDRFQGKSLSDPLRPQNDIPNISGATLSVRAVTTGARRALAVWKVLYGES